MHSPASGVHLGVPRRRSEGRFFTRKTTRRALLLHSQIYKPTGWHVVILLTLRRTSSTMSTATMRLSAVAGPRARVSLGRVRRAAPAPARRGASLARRAGETSAEPSAEFASLADRAASYTADLKEMGMTMPIIRRNVAGPKNDLRALQVYQDALAGRESRGRGRDHAAGEGAG
jgi:hypothetical protein